MGRARRTALRLVLGACVMSIPSAATAQNAAGSRTESRTDSLTAAQFAALSARLSDAGGSFDTDNLISNESSLLHPLGTLERERVRGGAYVGVGPDQNFNYLAQVSPHIAFVVDIRRDNLLHHLLYKALFAASRSRAEFLALWLGRPVPVGAPAGTDTDVDALIAWVARTPATPASRAHALREVRTRVVTYGIALSADDLATIARFHTAFIDEGPALRFTSTGRAPRDYYPTLGQLLAERDREGRQRSWLASERAFRTVQSLERRNLVIPVVGDLAGGVLTRLDRVLRERAESLSVIYTSNVEDYLIRDGRFPAFVRGVRALPRTANAMIIRSWFGGPGTHPQNVRGYYTTQLVEPVSAFVADPAVETVRRYWQLVGRMR